MSLPLRPGIGPQDLVNSLIEKARKFFWANTSLLVSAAPLQLSLRLLYKIVWQAMAWIIGAIFPTKATLEALSGYLYQCVLTMQPVERRGEGVLC